MNVICKPSNHQAIPNIDVYRGETLIGTVLENRFGEPVLTMFSDINGTQSLSFIDMDIIQDNWNNLIDKLRG